MARGGMEWAVEKGNNKYIILKLLFTKNGELMVKDMLFDNPIY